MDRRKILIFDDDVNILELCSIVLADYGYDVEVSETSHDIIEKVSQTNPDVILMDNWIPDIGGIKATQLLKSNPEFNHIPVIYFSANNDIHLLAETAGADAYLSKPFDLTELENMVSEVVNNKSKI